MASPLSIDSASFRPYVPVARLAEGGMGEIYLARLEREGGFEKLVVIKRLLPHLARQRRFREMLVEEATIAAQLSHPNICQVHDVGNADGQPFIAMEYLDGVSLHALLRRAKRDREQLDPDLVAGIMAQACDGLHAAHELTSRDGAPLGLIHRDVSPSNLFVTGNGVVKVLDFGVAKVATASDETQTGRAKGKWPYMSPEQVLCERLDRRSDIFSTGTVMFEALTNTFLFRQESEYLTCRQITEADAPRADALRPGLSTELADVVARALSRDPARRFDTALDMAAHTARASTPWGRDQIGSFVRDRFGAELTRRRDQIQTVLAHPRSEAPSIPTIRDRRETPTGSETPISDHRPEALAALARPTPAGGRWRHLVAAVAVIAVAGIAAYVVTARASEPAPGVPVIVYEGAVTPTAELRASADASIAPPHDAAPSRQRPSPPRDPYVRAVQRHRGRLARCFEDHSRGDLDAAARLQIEFDIDHRGIVESARLAGSAPVSRPLEHCILAIARRVRFGAQRHAVTVAVPVRATRR